MFGQKILRSAFYAGVVLFVMEMETFSSLGVLNSSLNEKNLSRGMKRQSSYLEFSIINDRN